MTCICCGQSMQRWEEASIYSCAACGYKAMISMPESNPYESAFALTEKFILLDASAASRALSSIRLAMIQGAGFGIGKVVDIGCSVGSFLAVAKCHGYDVFGIDCSPWAIEECRKKGIAAVQASADGLNGELPSADCVTMFDVLEHVRDPLSLIRHVAKRIGPRGVIAISTPNADGVGRDEIAAWRHYKPAEHQHFFTQKSLRHLLRKAGIDTVSVGFLESEIRSNPDREHNNILSVVGRKQ